MAFAQEILETASLECDKMREWFYEISAEKKPKNSFNDSMVYHPRPKKTKKIIFKTYEECKAAIDSDKKSIDRECRSKHAGPDHTITIYKSDFTVNMGKNSATFKLYFSSKELCEKNQNNGTERRFLQTVRESLRIYPKTSSESTRYVGECSEQLVILCSEKKSSFIGNYEVIE